MVSRSATQLKFIKFGPGSFLSQAHPTVLHMYFSNLDDGQRFKNVSPGKYKINFKVERFFKLPGQRRSYQV